VCIPGHHEGYLDWDTYQANQARLAANIRPSAHQPGTGALREGAALLQGLATCGVCGRKLAVYYDGPRKSTPGYYCASGDICNGRGVRHLRVGGVAIDTAVAAAFLAALAPSAAEAALAAAEHLKTGHETALAQLRRQLEQARYHAGRAERRYRSVDADNRLVARSLEADWNTALQQVTDAEADLARAEHQRPKALTDPERAAILALGADLHRVWSAPCTTDKDRKALLRTLLEEVNLTLVRDTDGGQADLVLRWKGGAITELAVPIRRTPANRLRTDEDTVDLVRRLAAHYPDATIAGILNRQHRETARGLSFTASRVQSLRHNRHIACHQPADTPEGDLLTVADAAKTLGTAPSTLHRWIADGFIPSEQLTPAAPRRIRLTDQLRALFVDDAPEGWLVMQDATKTLGVSRQTVLQRVKRGELHAVHIRTGRRKGLRINVSQAQDGLF
jgi:predicted DNA-binding transcriptional regulator AlpA